MRESSFVGFFWIPAFAGMTKWTKNYIFLQSQDTNFYFVQYRFPKNSPTLQWTKHAVEKMRFYGLSEARVKRVLENPKRREEGIADDTIACMQAAGTAKHPTEIWVMYQEKSKVKSLKSKVIVSVWRYPGRTAPRDPVPIPEDVLTSIYPLF